MEAASRPPLELLPDLPVEEPLDAVKAPAQAPKAAAAASAPKAAAPKDPEQTGLNFIDPEMFLAPGQEASAVPAEPAPAPAPVSPGSPELELLEDPVVDDMLTAPPPPPPAAPPAAAAKPAPVEPAASAAETRAAARVPIAKTASLTTAATKLAAASAASAANARTLNKPTSAPKPPPAAIPTARPAANGAAPAPGARPAPATAPAPPTVKATDANGSKPQTPNLASWATARSAATPAPKPTGASGNGAPAAAAAKPAATKPTAAPASTPAAATPMPASPPMDRDFIARNQVVERYLSGRLPVKGATDFERFCQDHPELLDAIGLPERVNAGLRLLEASGKPEPWHEAQRPSWQKPQVTIGLAAGVAVLGIALAVVAMGSSGKSHRIELLQKESYERALDPATSTREIRLLPSRSGASNSPAITIGGGSAQLADFRIDESRSPFHAFRITIDRVDQGRVGVITNLAKDSNGHLRIALNSSALGPGTYQLTLEGLDWRGDPQPDSWVTIGIAR
jgi:hypothetical protein